MRRLVVLSFGLLALFGCAGGGKKTASGVVTGTITYKGTPVNGATLVIYQATGAGDSFTYPTTQEGTFTITDAPQGEYKVVIQPSAGFTPHTKGTDAAKMSENKSKMEDLKTPATIKIPDKYKQRTTTDLTVTVTKDEQKVNFELKD